MIPEPDILQSLLASSSYLRDTREDHSRPRVINHGFQRLLSTLPLVEMGFEFETTDRRNTRAWWGVILKYGAHPKDIGRAFEKLGQAMQSGEGAVVGDAQRSDHAVNVSDYPELLTEWATEYECIEPQSTDRRSQAQGAPACQATRGQELRANLDAAMRNMHSAQSAEPPPGRWRGLIALLIGAVIGFLGGLLLL